MAVLFDPLRRRDIGLKLSTHPHQPVQRLRHIQRISYRQASDTRTYTTPRQHGKQRREHCYQITDQLESQCQPAVGDIIREIEQQILVDPLGHFLVKTSLGFVSPDSTNACQRLAEVREDGRSTDGVHALQLPHRLYVHAPH